MNIIKNLVQKRIHILCYTLFFIISGCTTTYKGVGEFKRNGEIGRETVYNKSLFPLHPPCETLKITRGFKSWPKHDGLDIRGKRNSPIYAAHSGKVIYAGNKFSGYGKMILLKYDDNWATLYAHLNKFNVRENQNIFKGQVIGYMGRTGRASGVHLHFELLRNKIPVNPLKHYSK